MDKIVAFQGYKIDILNKFGFKLFDFVAKAGKTTMH